MNNVKCFPFTVRNDNKNNLNYKFYWISFDLFYKTTDKKDIVLLKSEGNFDFLRKKNIFKIFIVASYCHVNDN